MPDSETHRKITRLLLSEDYGWVHDTLDAGTQILGPNHRRFTHTSETVMAIFLRSGGDIGAVIAAEAHIAVDVEVSRAKRLLGDLLFPRKPFKRRRR